MASGRMRRVDRAVQEVVSAHIAEDLKDPRIGFVTVTGVETSVDLRSARVYVSVLGGQAERDDALAGLRSASGYLRSLVGDELRMKRTPRLNFVLDKSIDTGMRMEKLISEVVPAPGEEDEG